jgi:pimeloyl-ACP methyl ester carboxylesterase
LQRSARGAHSEAGGAVLKLLSRFRRKSTLSPFQQTKLTGRTQPSTFESPALDIRADGHIVRATAYGHGPKHAPSLVFLHEGLGSIALWRGFPKRLADAVGCNAIVCERYGHGGSDSLTEPRRPDFLEREAEHALPDVLDSLGVERAILFGHSDGASIALLFAAAYPERTAGVISEAAHVIVEPLSIAGVKAAVKNFETGKLAGQLERYHGDNTRNMFRGWADIWLSSEFRDWSMVDRLNAVTAPVLAIQGEDDEYGTPEQLRLIAGGVSGPCETLLLPECGHVPHDQARDAVMSATVKFIEGLIGAETVT